MFRQVSAGVRRVGRRHLQTRTPVGSHRPHTRTRAQQLSTHHTPSGYSQISGKSGRQVSTRNFPAGVGRCLKTFWPVLVASMDLEQQWQGPKPLQDPLKHTHNKPASSLRLGKSTEQCGAGLESAAAHKLLLSPPRDAAQSYRVLDPTGAGTTERHRHGARRRGLASRALRTGRRGGPCTTRARATGAARSRDTFCLWHPPRRCAIIDRRDCDACGGLARQHAA